jgi:hypothetical protein
VFYIAFMPELPRPSLRLIDDRQVRTDPRVLQDFARVCRQMGILDPDTGLIRSPQRDQPHLSS